MKKILGNEKDCSFFNKCSEAEYKQTGDCVCFNPLYLLDRLEGKCKTLETKKRILPSLLQKKSVVAEQMAKREEKMVKKEAKKMKVVKAVVKREKGGETKESKLVKLLSGKEMFTVDEIVAKTGFAPASAKMYVSQDYLDRKEKPYRVVVGKKSAIIAYRLEVKKGK
jgi:hypothetical protein